MSVAKLNVTVARDLLNEFRFRDLFNELGWSAPKSKRAEAFTAGEFSLSRTPIGELSGIVVYEVESDTGGIPDRKAQALASKETAKTTLEHVLVFVDKQRTQSVWHWTKREGHKRQAREHYYFKGQPGDLFLSKLASLVVDLSELDEKGHLPLVAAADKVKRALDVERVIKRFFKDYDEQRIAFTRLISGIANDADRRWYASVLLNRLMFIYFLQRRFFLDGGDGLYLEHKLEQNPGTYFKGFLKVLFFEAFAKPKDKRSPEALKLTGDIRYLNGGLFLPHSLELKYEVDVPDQAFASLFKLFSHYSWNLNDIPGESDDDINPDVLGYIFEKYINQKEFGAYYTRPEITEYLCEQTIYRLILDRINEPSIDGLPEGKVFDSVPEMLVKLDRTTARKLLHDVLPDLSILDPAVGSGAFLVAALKTLLTVYSAVVGWLQFHDHAWLDQWTAKRNATLDRIQYAIKKAIITDNLYGVDIMEEATEIAKLRLFMTLVASAQNVEELEPLPNIDFNILAGNSLIGLTRVEDAEFEAKQSLKDKTASLFAPTKTYRQILNERNLKVDQYRHASGYAEDLAFLRDEVDKIEDEARPVLVALQRQRFDDLGVAYEKATWDDSNNRVGKPVKRSLTEDNIEGLNPFHWGFEFDSILNHKGGFDAIITNPPWEVIQEDQKEFAAIHFDDAIQKNKISTLDWEGIWHSFMADSNKRAQWLAHVSSLTLLKSYFRRAPEYGAQTSIIDGKNESGKLNLFSLFTERCFRLLRKGGLCGIVIPSGFYSDLGCSGLRKLVLEEARVTGIFGYENRKGVFEGVDSRFKFNLLTFIKAEVSDHFWVAFMRLDVSDLEYFRGGIGLELSLDQIRAISPGKLSIPEYRCQMDVDIAWKLSQHPTLCDAKCGSWYLDLNQEINSSVGKRAATGVKGPGAIAICPGESIHQFMFPFKPVSGYVDSEKGRALVLKGRAKEDVVAPFEWFRLSHRRIARSTDTRTLIATIIPPRTACLDTAMVHRNQVAGSDLLFAVSMMNSFTLDYLLRLSVDDHCDRHFMNDLGAPRLGSDSPEFRAIVRRAAMLICTSSEYAALWNEVDQVVGLDPASHTPEPGSCPWVPGIGVEDTASRAKLRAEIDGQVASIYGLTDEEFGHVLSTFPLVSGDAKQAALDEFRKITAEVATLLNDPLIPETRTMIAKGESEVVEFKQSLEAIVFDSSEWKAKGLNDNQVRDRRAEIVKGVIHSSLKTVCAFLNTEGGTLLIGVHDLGDVIGIEPDLQMVKGHSTDGFELKLRSMIKERFEPVPLGLVTVRFVPIDGKVVCRVDVSPDRTPHHLDGDVFVREGNNTLLLKGPDLTQWIARRMDLRRLKS